MQEKLPIQLSAHHASSDFSEFSDRCALTAQQKMRYSDYGTAETVPREGMQEPLVSTHSRGVVDLNRASDHPTLFPEQDFGKPTRNRIWKPDEELTEEERVRIFRDIYEAYHGELLDKIRSFKRPGLVVAWDNTAHYSIGKNEAGEETMMQPFILSNKGIEGSAEAAAGEVATCDPRFLEEFAIELRRSLKRQGLPDEVFLNLVYKGGYIGEHYNNRRHPELDVPQAVQSFQFEYDTILTHDQESLAPDLQAMAKLRVAAEQALYQTYTNLLTHNVGVQVREGNDK